MIENDFKKCEKNVKKRCKKMQEKFGGKEKVRIFAARLRNNRNKTDFKNGKFFFKNDF